MLGDTYNAQKNASIIYLGLLDTESTYCTGTNLQMNIIIMSEESNCSEDDDHACVTMAFSKSVLLVCKKFINNNVDEKLSM